MTAGGMSNPLINRTLSAVPYRFWVGVALIAIWWPISWLQIRPLSDNYFFPIWLGYIFTVDGLVYYRTGTSLIARSGWRCSYLFILSAPLWWLFEGLNEVLQNWFYHLPDEYGTIEFALRSILPFTTVIPAVFITTELVRSFRANPLRSLPRWALDTRTLVILHLLGWAMLIAVLTVPDYAFALVWISIFFIVDPVATLAGGRSLGSFIRAGDWSPLWNIALGTLICGVFWELWNYYSMPKWTYAVPHADFLHIFEMPVLGYGGYIPFGFEIAAIYALVSVVLPQLRWPRLKLSNEEPN